MNIEATIAGWIKSARTGAGLSGDALATKLSFELGTVRGNTKANISHWETGKHSPSLAQLLAIVKVTGTSLPTDILKAMQSSKGASAVVYDTAPNANVMSVSEAESTGYSVDRRTSTPWNMQPPEMLADLGVISQREAHVLSLFRMSVDEAQEIIEETAARVEKRPLSAVVDDQAKPWLARSNGDESL